MLMVIAALLLIGLSLGSFINALVWRVRQQELECEKSRPNAKRLRELSISKGRSMCPDCGHTLHAKDLIPVLSWLSVGGRCRYCRKPISVQYPLVELATAALLVGAYWHWPLALEGVGWVLFSLWVLILTGLVALTVYDLKWYLLPNRIMLPLAGLGVVFAVLRISFSPEPLHALVLTILSVLVGGGMFYVIFQISQGKWIGGGDVKLGALLGLVLGTPASSLLFIFLASLIGSLVAIPLLVSGRVKRDSVLPFGPFLILGAVIAWHFGETILNWYQTAFLLY